MTLSFRPLARADLPLVHDWLHRAHVRRWWRPAEEFNAAVAEYVDALEGRDPTRYFVVSRGERPVGLVQTYVVADDPEWEELVRTGPGVAGVDLFIGEESEVGRGLGGEILRAFLREVVFVQCGIRACVAGIDVENARSLRAFEKAGFRPVRDYVEDGRPHRLLRVDRPA